MTEKVSDKTSPTGRESTASFVPSSGACLASSLGAPGMPFFLGCSPRRGGNTDTALHAFAEAFPHGQKHTCFLRDLPVAPCIACGNCTRAIANNSLRLPDFQKNEPDSTIGQPETNQESKQPLFGCPLTKTDKSIPLLSSLLSSSVLCLVAPIYFYFLPAQVKALLDRTQPFWDLFSTHHSAVADLPHRLCYPILIAGRPRGEKLFEGSLISLRSSLRNLNIEVADPLLLRGLDAPSDLHEDQKTLDAVRAYGHKAYTEFSHQDKKR